MENFQPGPGIVKFVNDVISNTSKCVEYLRGMGIINSTMKCECGLSMNIKPRSDITDQQMWKCPGCTKTVSIRHGSLFQVS